MTCHLRELVKHSSKGKSDLEIAHQKHSSRWYSELSKRNYEVAFVWSHDTTLTIFLSINLLTFPFLPTYRSSAYLSLSMYFAGVIQSGGLWRVVEYAVPTSQYFQCNLLVHFFFSVCGKLKNITKANEGYDFKKHELKYLRSSANFSSGMSLGCCRSET